MEQCEQHEWMVFSTALIERHLMLTCRCCGAFGTVDDPTLEEWSAAYTAPSNPYLWEDGDRVTIRQSDNQNHQIMLAGGRTMIDLAVPCIDGPYAGQKLAVLVDENEDMEGMSWNSQLGGHYIYLANKTPPGFYWHPKGNPKWKEEGF